MKALIRTFVLLSGLTVGWVQVHAAEIEADTIRGKTQQTPVTVLQNRYFLKAMRPELGLVYGTVTNEAYTDTTLFGGRTSLFINEWVGIEFQSLKARVKNSDDRKVLNQIVYKKPTGETVSVDPEVNRVLKTTDISAVAAPFYGKLNLADWLIVYSDLTLSAGISKVGTDQGDLNALSYGVGQRFYWAKSLSLRIDFRDRIYTEKRAGKDYRKNTYSIDFGLSYFLF